MVIIIIIIIIFLLYHSCKIYPYNKEISSSFFLKTLSAKSIPETDFSVFDFPRYYLTNKTEYIHYPAITDIVAVPNKASTVVYAVFSALNLKVKEGWVEYDSFALIFNNTHYNNTIPAEIHVESVRVLKFMLPPLVCNDHFIVDIMDLQRNHTYHNLFVHVRSSPKIGGIAVCAMVSDYNTVGEVESWVTWYKLQHFENVILYSIKPIPVIEKAIAPVIKTGFIQYYRYNYTLNNYRSKEQRSIQIAMINSCYYRHKHLYDGIVMIDLDEFLYSPLHPFNAKRTMTDLLRNRTGHYFRIDSTMYYIKPSTKHKLSFKNHSIFSDYVYKEDTGLSGRKKYMMRTTAESALSVHFCKGGCMNVPYAKKDIISIIHFKNAFQNKTKLEFDDSLERFTPILQRKVRTLFS